MSALQLFEPVIAPILIDGLSWREFKIAEQLLAHPGVRLSFLDGILELQNMPGRQYEILKKRIAALVEIYLEWAAIDFVPTGSMTLESATGQVKREADESYELGTNRQYPDLVIEVVVSSGGLNKLAAYQRLSIPEVWFWEKGSLSIYALQDAAYQELQSSQVLPNLNIPLLTHCVNLSNHSQAVREFRQSLAG